MKPKIIITGASGFIGTNLIKFLEPDYNILAIDRHELKYSSSKIKFSQLDLLNLERLIEVFQEFEPLHVVHLAARTDLDGKNLDDYKDNTTAVDNLLTAIELANSVETVIVSSSMLVCSVGHIPLDMKTYSPTTLYGRSKVMGEKLVRAKLQVLPRTCIVRPTSIWGPYFEAPYRNFFSHVLSKRFFYFGKLCDRKTYGYVENTIGQILGILRDQTWNSGDVFYLGDTSPMSIDEFAQLIVSEAKLPVPITFSPYVIKITALIGDILKTFKIGFPMTSFRLKNIRTRNVIQDNLAVRFNVNPEISNALGVKKTLTWLSNNEKG
jgi:GlcNAc-P-P-Und epimerase